MSVAEWFKRRFSKAPTAMSLYKAGMEKAQQQDNDGAISNYSRAIELADCPVDVKAMALYNRAVVLAANKEIDQAIDDLNAVLKMNGASVKVQKAASQKLDKIRRRSGKID